MANELVIFAQEWNVTFWLSAGRVLNGLLAPKNRNRRAGIKRMRDGIEVSAAADTPLCLTVLYRFLAEAHAQLGQTRQSLHTIGEALRLAERTQECFFVPALHRFEDELLLRQGNCDAEIRAEECFRRALDLARQQSAKSWELRAGTSLSRLWAHRGRRAEALELLAPLSDWFAEGHDTADLINAHKLIEELR